MTEEEKDILIEKMIDQPLSLTDEELNAIMEDSELKEIYEVSSSLKGFSLSKIDIDGQQEWELFRPRIKKKTSPFRWMMRMAAIFLGILLLSSVLNRIIDGVFDQSKKPVISQVNEVLEDNPETRDENKNLAVNSVTISTGKVDNKHQQVINKTINTPKAIEEEREIEIQRSNQIDIDEYLRIQEARIENDLALLTAEIYKEEMEYIKPELESQGVDEEWIEKEIKKVTMQ